MHDASELEDALRRIDGRGYKAYKTIAGTYRSQCGKYQVCIDHVQGDPFAEPSRFRILVGASEAALPSWAIDSRDARTATADFLNRQLAGAFDRLEEHCGSGKSGALVIQRPRQEVLERTSLLIHAGGKVEARFRVGLPARGRTVLGRAAASLIFNTMDRAIAESLFFSSIDEADLRQHADSLHTSIALRHQLKAQGLVAFVADGAVLPRRSGVDSRAASGGDVVAFKSPSSMRVDLVVEGHGPISGMGIPRGVNLIVGGGYHGKSTLLAALESGVYDHIPGDGRERVVAVDGAVKIRADDGRAVAGVDIRNFINGLPGGQNTGCFSTANASGSTSQAAAIVEALEVGATCLLLDEDTCATNFMIRDARMQRLISCDDEPIRPFIDRVGQLCRDQGVSTVIVVGGAGDYFDVADTVVGMRAYRPQELTAQAREVANQIPSLRREQEFQWCGQKARHICRETFQLAKHRRRGRGIDERIKIQVRGSDRLAIGSEEIVFSAVEQVVEAGQVRAMAEAMVWLKGCSDLEERTLPEMLAEVVSVAKADGLSCLQRQPTGDLAAFRVYELAGLLGRLRTLKIRSAT